MKTDRIQREKQAGVNASMCIECVYVCAYVKTLLSGGTLGVSYATHANLCKAMRHRCHVNTYSRSDIEGTVLELRGYSSSMQFI